ncbi:cold-shock protein [Erythrobacter rubeus]|uniref:Cold-shock protein n=1 Tax=Erythrobacter rubeus TaxID=2760803 RepID=A0ABR8KKR8_9SPHN|nr:cold-shock protein [Erythrobacter rubeus]MBD2840887.1 cold-shock protein [Erythrobacter rubeus]
MAYSGTIKSYNAAKGAGTITPQKGDTALPFNKSDLQNQAQEPREGQPYSYETREVNGGNVHATSMHPKQNHAPQGQKAQARQQQG